MLKAHQSAAVQRDHDAWDEDQLQDDARQRIGECTGKEDLPGKDTAAHAQLDLLYDAPYDPARQHGADQTAI